MRWHNVWHCRKMTKNVLLTISGLQDMDLDQPEADDDEPIEVITPASYYLKNGKHYVLYEEPVEGMAGSVKSRIRFTEDGEMEVTRSGLTNTRMIFEKDKIHMSQYQTPYGEMMVGIYTTDMQVDVREEDIDVSVDYALDINSEKVADCSLVMNIKATQEKTKDRLTS